MRNRKRVRPLTFAVLALMGTLLSACGTNGNSDNGAADAMGSTAGHTMTHADSAQANAASPTAEASATEPRKQYKLEAALRKEGDQFVIDIDTDLTFSSSQKPVYGEGHIHFYVNGKLTGPIITTNGPYPVEDYMLSDGDNAIRLALVNNNHAETYNASVELKITKNE